MPHTHTHTSLQHTHALAERETGREGDFIDTQQALHWDMPQFIQQLLIHRYLVIYRFCFFFPLQIVAGHTLREGSG